MSSSSPVMGFTAQPAAKQKDRTNIKQQSFLAIIVPLEAAIFVFENLNYIHYKVIFRFV